MILKKKYIILIFLFILISIIGSFLFFNKTEVIKNYDSIIKNDQKTVEVKRADIEKQVFVTGTLEPKEDAHLAFEVSGKVKQIFVKVGDKVKKEQKLATLHSGDIWTQKLAQNAQLKAEKARLEEIKRGPRSEDLYIQKTNLYNTQTAIKDSKMVVIDRIQEAYTQSEYVIYDKGDFLFSNPRSRSMGLRFHSNNSILENQIKNDRASVGRMLEKWKQNIDSFHSENNLQAVIFETKNNLHQIKAYLDKLARFVNSLNPSGRLSQSSIDTLKLSISTSRNNTNTAISNLSVAEGQWNTANSSFKREQAQLNLLDAGSTPQQITVYESRVKLAEAQIQNINIQLSKTILYAPINGTITKQDITVGEINSANRPIISIVGDEFEIEAEISEINIAKVKKGNLVNIVFDAFEDRTFMGKIMIIEPQKKVINGTAYYTAKVGLEESDEQFLPGMSADLYVISEKKEKVLSIPQEAVFYEEDKTFVKKVIALNKTTQLQKTSIKVGLSGSNGLIEVKEGLLEGALIVIPN